MNRNWTTILVAVVALGPAVIQAAGGTRSAFPSPTTELVMQPRTLSAIQRAVGTVRPRLESRVMAQASGRILAVNVSAGATVEKGQILATIDDRELALRLSQARSGVAGAEAARRQAEQGRTATEAALAQARSERDRVQRFLESKAATPQQMEQAESAFQQAEAHVAQAVSQREQAEAGVRRAEEAVKEIQVLLDYSRVTAPLTGVVAERMVDPGDLAWPGRPLLLIQDPTVLRLEAHVREGLTGAVFVGQELEVWIDALAVKLSGTVDEVVPLADPVTRKFVVKVKLPGDARLLPGMFGRLGIPLGTRSTLVLPPGSVTTVGQLDLVQVREQGRWIRRLVRLGPAVVGGHEVLSGLAPGEVVGIGGR